MTEGKGRGGERGKRGKGKKVSMFEVGKDIEKEGKSIQ